MLRQSLLIAGVLMVCVTGIAPVRAMSCNSAFEQLSTRLYLDASYLPDDFDRNTLIRLFDFLEKHVMPDQRTLFPEYVNRLPVIVRYVPFIDVSQLPSSAEDLAGWTDVTLMDDGLSHEANCRVGPVESASNQTIAFLVLVVMPNTDDADYLAQLWGFTAHELAHTFGAVHGPRFPFYEDDKLVARIEPTSDAYYWFGIAHVFEPGFQGIVWDAWHNACIDGLCDALRREVFLLGLGL